MAKNLNINRGVNDPFYRYKMPRLLAKVEGKGNGIKTVIANMSEIAKALSRPPTYPTKYFGCELGAQTNFDMKNERYIVNGEHDANKLQDILDGFIKKFVLCPACDNPETVLSVKSKSQAIQGKCKACGHAYTVDPKQKLSTFILKNPPPVEGSEPESKEKRDGGGSPTEELGANDGNHTTNHTNGGRGDGSLDDEEDDDWAPVDDSTIKLDGKLSSAVGKLVIDSDMDKPLQDRLDMLHEFFVDAKKDGSIYDWKKMVNEAERLELKNKAPLLLANVLFDADVVNQIKTSRPLLIRFCDGDSKAQRHLLGGIEQLVAERKEQLMGKMAHIIKALYDNDICEEETLLGWGEKPSKKYVNKDLVKEMIKVAQPVLTWLKEADEASEDEEDDAVVNFDDRAGKKVTIITNEKAVEAKKIHNATKDENEEELNIDDI